MSILAGLMIGIGCILYLTIGGIPGAIAFSLGLMTVCLYKLKLFTGQAYKISIGEIKVKEIAKIWLGNFIGTALAATFAMALPNRAELIAAATKIMEAREQASLLSLILAIPCGMLMTFAVRQPHLNLLYIIFCVAGFILGGFYHCVADMFYTILGAHNIQHWFSLLFVTIGNIIGCNIYTIFSERGF